MQDLETDGIPIEGPLGEGKTQCMILLREPNNTHPRPREFWFKEQIYGERQRSGAKYIWVYEFLLSHLLGDKDVFSFTAYMNLCPFCGGNTKSRKYQDVLEAFGETDVVVEHIPIDENSTASDIAQNRMAILQEAARDGLWYIITTSDIFDALARGEQTDVWLEYRFGQGKKERFRSCTLPWGEGVTLLEFWHPSNPCLSIKKEQFTFLGGEKIGTSV